MDPKHLQGSSFGENLFALTYPNIFSTVPIGAAMLFLALVAIIVGLACVGVSIMIFVEFGRLKAQAGANAVLVKVQKELRNLAIIQLVSGVILTLLGFLYLHSGKGQTEMRGKMANTMNYVHRRYRNFQDKRLAAELEELLVKKKRLDGKELEIKARLAGAPVVGAQLQEPMNDAQTGSLSG